MNKLLVVSVVALSVGGCGLSDRETKAHCSEAAPARWLAASPPIRLAGVVGAPSAP